MIARRILNACRNSLLLWNKTVDSALRMNVPLREHYSPRQGRVFGLSNSWKQSRSISSEGTELEYAKEAIVVRR